MKEEQLHVFPATKANSLDNKLRRILQNPYRILAPFVSDGLNVVDYGCGNGFFSLPLSKMTGNSGKVYSVDIQKEMLDKLTIKLQALNISNIFPILKTREKINFPVLIDFAIAVYVVHEISDKLAFFEEVFNFLKPGGKLLLIEPDFVVSKLNFNKTLEFSKQAGFVENEKLNLLFSKARIMNKEK
ncbi:MAG: methyltransferase domain-containing protein [Bacteroidales bacterium]